MFHDFVARLDTKWIAVFNHSRLKNTENISTKSIVIDKNASDYVGSTAFTHYRII